MTNQERSGEIIPNVSFPLNVVQTATFSVRYPKFVQFIEPRYL